MAMEPHKLRFVRCPKCYQLLVEYPSIPVYKCGGCGTVLRAKNRAQPAVQAKTESDAQNNLPSSLMGSPQDSKPSCSDEHKTPPHEAAADGIISSPINRTNSCEEATGERAMSVEESEAPAQHPKEETCLSVDKGTQDPAVPVKDMQEGSTEADLGPKSSGEVKNLDTSEHGNRVEVDKAEMSVMRTLDEKTELVQREEKLQMYEGVHVESHEALIEELERSLSFSSDDEYFSDEAETSGLSDALRHQMGSRRFMFGGQINDSSRNDPHGRLIEELEMSFSDVEDPMEQHGVGADRINGNEHDKHPQTLDAESANPCEESIPSLDDGHLESKKNSHHREEPIERHAVGADRIDGNGHDKHPQTLDAESANPCEESTPSLDDGHLESEKTSHQILEMSFGDVQEPMEQHAVGADRINGNEHDKHPQTVDATSANPCEKSITSVDDGHLESEKTSHQGNRPFDIGNEEKEGIKHDNNSANNVHENEHDEHLQILGRNSAHSYEESIPPLENGNLESEQTFLVENKLIDHYNEGKEDSEGDYSTANDDHVAVANEVSEERFQEEKDSNDFQLGNTEVEYPCESIVSSVDDSDTESNQTIQPNGLTSDDTQENRVACMDDGSNTSYIHGNKNVLFTDEDVAAKVHGNQEVPFDHTRGNEENHMEDDNPSDSVYGEDICADVAVAEEVHGNEEVALDRTGENEENNVQDVNPANSVHGEDNVAVADEHIAEEVDKNELDKDQQSQEAKFSNSSHFKAEVIFKQKDLIADSGKQKEEDVMGDDHTTNSAQEDNTAVASFTRWSNKRTQCKLYSFNKKQEAPYKYGAGQLRQGLSLDAKDFKSIENFIESQMDGTSSSLSSGSPSQGDLLHGRSNKFNVIARHERLKKMDELRDQLSRLSSQKSIEENYQKRGLEYQQQHSNSYDVEQHLQSADVDSVPNSCTLESYYGYGRPPRYHPPNHFSPTHTYPHCDFGHAQARIPYNYDEWEFNSYYQSSYAESTLLDHDSMMSSYKEPKRVVRKHILRPLSGASPFSICSGCFNLIQMPSDMYISKAKVGKMQCGRCSKVIVLSFPAACHGEGKISVDVLQQSNKPAGSTLAKNKDATSHSAECLGGPVSINEEYRASFTRSFSTQAGASLAATQSGKKVSDSALHRLMGYDSASQLLRHSRALDDGYDSFESMVPVSRRVNRRKNM